MAMLRTKRSQAAQGMVEFALVLPILLIVILGIIAFGHLFFVYSFTVASSREAARWGSAVGVASAGGLNRYQDCDAIRAAAQRTGGIIGVTPNVVTVGFDHGPNTAVYANCPIGGQGPDVQLGDRIVVTVNITYQPIVPLINLPTIPLQGITARTVIRDVPVGEAPTAEPPCTETKTVMTLTSAPLDVNIFESFSYVVKGKNTGDPNPTKGTVDFYVDDTLKSSKQPISGTFTNAFLSPGWVSIRAAFTSTDSKFCPSNTTILVPDQALLTNNKVEPPEVYVRTPSMAVITSDTPDPSDPTVPFIVVVKVTKATGYTSANIPSGTFTVKDAANSTITCMGSLDPATGIGSCTFNTYPIEGQRNLVATYQGDVNFTESLVSAQEPHMVYKPAVPPPVNPGKCPEWVVESYFYDQSNAFYFKIKNPDTTPANLTKVTVIWPEKSGGSAFLQELRYGDIGATSNNAICGATPTSACVWKFTTTAEDPTDAILGLAPNNWRGGADLTLAPGAQKELRAVYSTNLYDTDPKKKKETKYQMILEFDKFIKDVNGNTVQCIIEGPVSERP